MSATRDVYDADLRNYSRRIVFSFYIPNTMISTFDLLYSNELNRILSLLNFIFHFGFIYYTIRNLIMEHYFRKLLETIGILKGFSQIFLIPAIFKNNYYFALLFKIIQPPWKFDILLGVSPRIRYMQIFKTK